MTNTKTKGSKRAKENKIVDIDKLIKLTEERGYTVTKVCNIVGITPSSYWNWKHYGGRANPDSIKRIAKLFNVPVDSLYVNGDESSKTGEIGGADTSNGDSLSVIEKPNNLEFKEIGDTQNVHVLFETINSNIITLSNVLMDYVDKKFDALYMQLHEEIQKQSVSDKSSSISKQKPIAFVLNKVELDKLVTGYNENDTYEVYRDKINRMVSIICKYNRIPHKNLLHRYYVEMTNTYGVVYDQLKKEYYDKYQHKDNGSTELIYENPIFKQIFYNLISDELKKVTNG